MMGLVYRNFRSITVSLISYDSWAKYQDCGAGEGGGGDLTSTKSRSVSKGILGLWLLMSPVHSFFCITRAYSVSLLHCSSCLH